MGKIRDRGHDGGSIYRWNTLERLVKENNWTQGAELGVHNGVNFKHLINTCPNLELIGVDLYAAQPENNGPEKWTPGENGHPWKHEDYFRDMKSFCEKHPGRAFIFKDYTTSVADKFIEEHFDFVFIDADHGYEGCLRDIKAWAPKVKKGGYVIGHDIHFPTVEKAVTEYFGPNSWNVEDDFMWWVKV